MGERLSTVQVRGLAVLDDRWVPTRLHAADTTVTEADPQPGTVETIEEGARLVPQLVGVQSQSAHLVVTRSGEPGLGISSALLIAASSELNAALGPVQTAEVGYYLADGTETEADLRGLDPPTKVTDWRQPGPLVAPDVADAATLSLSGKVALRWNCTGGVRFVVWNPYDESFENLQTLPSAVNKAGALVCVPGSDRLLCLADTGAVFSDNYGATWSAYSRTGPQQYETTLNSTYTGKVRAGFDGQGNLLWAATEAVSGDLHLYASSDLGVSWTLVEAVAAAGVKDWDLAAHPDGSIYIVYIDASDVAQCARLGAFQKLTAALPVAVFSDAYGGDYTTQAVWIGIDYNGAVWVYGEDSTNAGLWRAAISANNGSNFFDRLVYPVLPFAYAWNAGGGTYGPAGWRLAPNAAGGFVAAACFGSVGAGVQHGGMARLGGWTTPQPVNRLFGKVFDDTVTIQRDKQWIGYGRPEDVAGAADYAKTGTATTTHSSSDGSPVAPLGYVKIDSGGGALSGYYSGSIGNNGVSGAHGLVCVEIEDDGGTEDRIGVLYVLDDTTGNKSCSVALYFTNTGFRVRDVAGAAWFAAEVAHDMTAGRTWFSLNVNMEAETFEVLYRRDGTNTWERAFYDAVSFVNATTTTDSGLVRWGHQVAGATDGISRWWCSQHSAVTTIAESPEADNESYTGVNVYGTTAGDYPYPIPELWDATTERPCFLLMRGSVGVEGESYSHEVLPAYPVRALFPTIEPSPARTWRSTTKGVDHSIALDRGYDGRPYGAHSLLFAVLGANCRQWRLEYKEDGGSSYVTLGTLDLATGFSSVGFTRYGEVVVPASGGAGSRYLAAGETAGGTLVLDIGGTPVAVRIKTNTPGFFDASTSGPRATIVLQQGFNTATLPTSGLASIVWPSGVMALHGALLSSAYKRYWRVTCLSSNKAAESYYEAGSVGLYALKPPGKRWGNGWEWSHDPNISESRDRYGTARRDQLGPERRVLTQSWDHGFKMDRIRGKLDADYVGYPGAAALAARDDVYGQLVDTWRQSQGGRLPCIALLTELANGATLTDPSLWLYCYLAGSLRAQHATGEHNVAEFMRAGPVRLEEIV